MIHVFTFNPDWVNAGSSGRAVKAPSLIFFDGVCGLCNRFVDFIIRHDAARRYRFAPLQGVTASEKLENSTETPATVDYRSVILLDDERIYTQSTAVLKIFSGLGGGWRVMGLLKFVPSRLRDWIYGYFARHRYHWFGKKASCRLPSPSERDLFLP